MTHKEVVAALQKLAAVLEQLEACRAAWAKKLGVEHVDDLRAIQSEYSSMAPVYAQQAIQNPGGANPLQKQMDRLEMQIAHVAEIGSAMSVMDEIGRMADDLTIRGEAVAAATKAALG